ncbi:MAG: hypothetical protein U0133_02070 [Gemmatimonadales bacterium]
MPHSISERSRPGGATVARHRPEHLPDEAVRGPGGERDRPGRVTRQQPARRPPGPARTSSNTDNTASKVSSPKGSASSVALLG